MYTRTCVNEYLCVLKRIIYERVRVYVPARAYMNVCVCVWGVGGGGGG